MSVEHHDLIHEFPELKDRIHEMKMGDQHFRKLFDEYHELTRNIEKMEDDNGQPSHWNMKPKGEEFFTDSADTLKEAKLMIARWEG